MFDRRYGAKADDQLLTREEALRLYTRSAAWIGFPEEDRGTLSAGKLADLAVLDKPHMTMPVGEIDTVRSVLTLLGGKVVHDADVIKAARPSPPAAADYPGAIRMNSATTNTDYGRTVARTLRSRERCEACRRGRLPHVAIGGAALGQFSNPIYAFV